MNELINLINISDIITTIVGGAILGSLAWAIKLFISKRKIADYDVQGSQVRFKELNQLWISKKRKIISRKANELNLNFIPNRDSLSAEASPLLAKKEWVPENPIPIHNVSSELIDHIPADVVPRTDILPFRSEGLGTFRSYSEAVKTLLKPTIFKSNRQYRLMNVRVSAQDARLLISGEPHEYFNKIDYGKTAELEFTASLLNVNKIHPGDTTASLKKLPSKRTQSFRKKHINALFSGDFSKTLLLSGVSTLTLIKTASGSYRFLMHIRSTKQGFAEGTRHVVPAGEFQPLSLGNNFETDTNILYNILREYAEEIGGHDEFEGEKSRSFNYTSTPPFNRYLQALNQGTMRIWYLGFGLDPLSLQGEHLTCALFQEDTFHALFGTEVRSGNTEGEILSDSDIWGIPFTKEHVEEQYRNNILPAGEAALKLAFRHLTYMDKTL